MNLLATTRALQVFWTDPGTHEFGHWFSLPHTFRVGGGQGLGVSYWGDTANPNDYADGFTDTLIDHVGAVQSLDDNAGFLYQHEDGTPKLYSELTEAGKTEARNRFRDHYAKEFFGVTATYSSLNATQLARIPPFDTAAPAPVTADRERLAIHLYGAGWNALQAHEQNGITNAIANPDNNWWIKTARFGLWYCRVDDDLIARRNFSKFYDQLNAGELEQMRLLNANIIAYRAGKGSPYGIFSEQQLDRMCDLISQPTNGLDRSSTRGLEFGRYVFLGGATTHAFASLGSSLRPYSSISPAHTAAPVRSIIIGRPGTYGSGASSITLNKPMSLRATRAGSFTLRGN